MNLPNTTRHAGCDTKAIFKRNKDDLNIEFLLSKMIALLRKKIDFLFSHSLEKNKLIHTVTIGMEYKYIYISSSSSSSCHAISTDIPDHLSPPLPIVHCFRHVICDTSRIGTDLLYVGSSWSSRLYSSMWGGPRKYITYELVPTSLAVSRMSGSSNFDSFRDGW